MDGAPISTELQVRPLRGLCMSHPQGGQLSPRPGVPALLAVDGEQRAAPLPASPGNPQ